MALGLFLLSILAGVGASVLSLLAGGSVLGALLVYTGASSGALGLLAVWYVAKGAPDPAALSPT
jgi:hypothetical protein